jgi:diguanylate cyclase (GGDEF)-like protein
MPRTDLPTTVRLFVRERLMELIHAASHPPYLSRHRADAVTTRVRLVSAAFAAFTLFWIILDRLTLPWPIWGELAALRTVSAAIFVALAYYGPPKPSLRQAFSQLGIMLGNPVLFYIAAQTLFVGLPLSDAAEINARLYEMLPFVVMAGLSVFPLTVVEGVMFAAPILVLTALVPALAGGFNWVDQLSTLWVLVLILGVYMMAGMIQLHYMMALLRRASHDVLTGAHTRRSGMEMLDLYFSLSQRQDMPLSVMFIDIDNFKSVNDHFGHEAGDAVLRGVSATLHRVLRRADVVVRWGGEEFVILLPNTNREGSRTVVARLLQDWLGPRPDGNPVTASIGLAERLADHAGDWPELVDRADHRMYSAKTSGKARCVLDDETVLLPDDMIEKVASVVS